MISLRDAIERADPDLSYSVTSSAVFVRESNADLIERTRELSAALRSAGFRVPGPFIRASDGIEFVAYAPAARLRPDGDGGGGGEGDTNTGPIRGP